MYANFKDFCIQILNDYGCNDRVAFEMNNIIIYNTEDGKAKINLILDNGSV